MLYSNDDVLRALKGSGIKKGDTLFVTTSLGMLGAPKVKGRININKICKIILDSIKKVLGLNGTILVPTYSYSFGKTDENKMPIFDLKNTPSKIGPFSNFFIKQKGVIRSEDPMVSIAALGKNAKKIFKKISRTSYGKDCVFERILKIKNAKCCSIGLGPNWIPFIHYSDWLNKAPFRYDKFFEGIIVSGKTRKKVIWHYPVRYLRKETLANGHKLGKLAVKAKIFHYQKLGRSKVYVAEYKKYFNFVMKIIKKNPWITVNGPKYKFKKNDN